MTGRLEAICLSDRKGVPKVPVDAAEARADHGLVGDAHAGLGGRQVSILPRESIAQIKRAMPDLADGAFAENLIVSGLPLGGARVGDRLRLGESVILEVTQIGKECHRGCAIREITGDCIMPREGLFCRVIAGGSLRPGAAVSLVRGAAPRRVPFAGEFATAAVVLIGGRSRRFGVDKASWAWRGRPLVDHVVARLRELTDEIVLVASPERSEMGWRSRGEAGGVRFVTDDPELPPGPLRGLVTGLRRVRAPYAWAVGCDAPALVPDLLAALRRRFEPHDRAVLPVAEDRLQTLVACYDRRAAATLAQQARRGERALHRAVASLPHRAIPPEQWRRWDPAGTSFRNLNTPADAAALDASLASRGPEADSTDDADRDRAGVAPDRGACP